MMLRTGTLSNAMPRTGLAGLVVLGTVIAGCLAAGSAQASDPTAAQALRLTPIQKDVDYDQPTGDDIDKCRIEPQKVGQASGWTVYGPQGQMLRRFLDSNGDGVVDQWCYYKDGIEVYRDIDSNHNRKADQFRWLNTAGTRWGVDRSGNGEIDHWLQISAEEVTQELIAAMAAKDEKRFARLLLTGDELKQLGLSAERDKELADKLSAAAAAFRELAASQTAITPQANWLHFGGSKPGLVPAGTDEVARDLVVYENVVTVVEAGGKHEQVYAGTLVQAGRNWRLIDAPRILGSGGELAGGFFFRLPAPHIPDMPDQAVQGIDENTRQVLAEIDKIDQQLATASPDEQAKLHARRADLLSELADAATSKSEQAQWLRQFADMVSIAVQSGGYPDGLGRLQKLVTELKKDQANNDLAAYVAFRHLTAQYGQSLQQPDADFAKIQETWIENLARFVEDYPKATDGAEAMLQLGIAEEFGGNEGAAKGWYGKIVSQFPSSTSAKKAAGAKRRLEIVGQPLELRGPTLDGRTVNVASLRGRTVLVHYWATWCEPCKDDMQTLKNLLAQYGRQGFVVVGVNLDTNRSAAESLVRQESLTWPHLHEEGGLESRLANELGILTLPTMLLIGADGKVVNRSIHISEVEPELKKLLNQAQAAGQTPAARQ